MSSIVGMDRWRDPLTLAAMALETSPQSPAPVRQIANLISQYVDRLGAVWVEGQIAQVSRRPGLSTVFMTLRDSVADISVPLTCPRSARRLRSRRRWSRAPAWWCTPSRPTTPTAARFSLAVREIRMVGLGELLARLERRRQLLAAEGLFAARAQAVAAVPAAAGSGWSPLPARPPSATCSTTRGAAGPTSPSRSRTPRCRASGRPPR